MYMYICVCVWMYSYWRMQIVIAMSTNWRAAARATTPHAPTHSLKRARHGRCYFRGAQWGRGVRFEARKPLARCLFFLSSFCCLFVHLFSLVVVVPGLCASVSVDRCVGVAGRRTICTGWSPPLSQHHECIGGQGAARRTATPTCHTADVVVVVVNAIQIVVAIC